MAQSYQGPTAADLMIHCHRLINPTVIVHNQTTGGNGQWFCVHNRLAHMLHQPRKGRRGTVHRCFRGQQGWEGGRVEEENGLEGVDLSSKAAPRFNQLLSKLL